jgi:hypothetical protein
MTTFQLTELDKAIQGRIKNFRDKEIQHSSLMQNFKITKAGAKEFINYNYTPSNLINNEVNAIIKCSDYNFSLWHNMKPSMNYDITIYLLSVLGASDTISEINGIRKNVYPPDISEKEEGEIKALLSLFNKYGKPRS